jgi:WD40 repeat protein
MVKPNTLNIAINGDKLERLNTLSEISLSLSKLKQRVESNIKNLRCMKNKLFTALESIFDHEYSIHYSLAKQLSDHLILIEEHKADTSELLECMIQRYTDSGPTGLLDVDVYDVNEKLILDALMGLLGIERLDNIFRRDHESDIQNNLANLIKINTNLQETQGSLQLLRKFSSPLQDLKTRSSLSPKYSRSSTNSPRPKPEIKLKRMQILNPVSMKLSKPSLPELPDSLDLLTLKAHSSAITCLCISPDSKFLLSGSLDKSVKLWSFSHKNILKEYLSPSCVYSCVMSPGSEVAWIGCGDGSIRMLNLDSMREVDILKGHKGRVFCMNMTGDRKFLISGSGDGTLIIWSLNNLRVYKKLQGHNSVVYSLAVSRDSKYVVSGAGNGSIIVWRIQDGAIESVLEGHTKRVSSIDISTDDRYILSSSYDNTIKLWDLSTSTLLRSVSTQKTRIDIVQFSPKSDYILACSPEGSISLYSLLSCLAVNTVRLCETQITSAILSTDFKCVIVGCNDSIKIWSNYNLY